MFRPLSREVKRSTTLQCMYFVHSALATKKRLRLCRIQRIHSKLSLNCLTHCVTRFQKKKGHIVLNHDRLEFMLVIFRSKKGNSIIFTQKIYFGYLNAYH